MRWPARPLPALPWHTRGVNAITTLLAAIADSFTPDGTMARMRFRTSLDMVLTLLVTLLAVGLAVGYQVFGRWARRSQGGD